VKTSRRVSAAILSLPLILLTGCLFHLRHLPVPKAPSIVQTVTPQQLVDRLNQRWAAFDSLDAKVEIQASELKTAEGIEKDIHEFPAIILVRKPEMLRVYGQVPVLGTRMFDMTSNGKTFTLWIPSKNKAVEGPAELHKKSASQLENLRPKFFYNAMVVSGLEPDEYYTVAADSETVEDAAKKHLFTVPEYVLTVMRQNPNPVSHQMALVRVITFHRDDLLPYQQDLYDSDGNLESQVFYGPYQNFGSLKYPSVITIKLPLISDQIVLTVESVKENMKLTDQEFQIKLPEGIQIQRLD